MHVPFQNNTTAFRVIFITLCLSIAWVFIVSVGLVFLRFEDGKEEIHRDIKDLGTSQAGIITKGLWVVNLAGGDIHTREEYGFAVLLTVRKREDD